MAGWVDGAVAHTVASHTRHCMYHQRGATVTATVTLAGDGGLCTNCIAAADKRRPEAVCGVLLPSVLPAAEPNPLTLLVRSMTRALCCVCCALDGD